jgi:hypothetical protein
VTGLWFSPGTPVSSTNKTDCHDITEILMKVELQSVNYDSDPTLVLSSLFCSSFFKRKLISAGILLFV